LSDYESWPPNTTARTRWRPVLLLLLRGPSPRQRKIKRENKITRRHPTLFLGGGLQLTFSHPSLVCNTRPVAVEIARWTICVHKGWMDILYAHIYIHLSSFNLASEILSL
jgi:hypothetical protein